MERKTALAIGRAVQMQCEPYARASLPERIADELMKAAAGHECPWRLAKDWEGDTYDTSCGNGILIMEQTLEDAIKDGQIYCTYCRGRIVPTEAEWQAAERVEREAEEVG